MKRTTLFCAIAAIAAISCAKEMQNNSYHIVGSAKSELEGSTIYINEAFNKTTLDSTVVVNGQFELKGSLAAPAILTLNNGVKEILLTTGKVANVTIDEEMTVEQSPETEAIHTMEKELYDTEMAARKFFSENRNDREAITAKFEELQGTLSAIHSKYLNENHDNLVGAYSVARQAGNTETLEQLDSLIALAPLSADLYYVANNRNIKLQALKTAAGEPFVDFSGSDIEGNPSKLSDYVGKGSYVLVDFWASWCGPCRAEMPNLRAAYESHKTDGLVLLGVNVWDNKEACIKAIEEEEMTWPILYASDNTVATDSYGILGIPTIILFAPDGTIVDRHVRGPKIKELTDEIFTK